MRDLMLYYLQFVILCGMGIYIFAGYHELIRFINGFTYIIVVTSPITLTLAIICLIKDALKWVKENKPRKEEDKNDN